MHKTITKVSSYYNYSDELIVKEILNGNTSLYEIIVKRYNQRLFRIQKTYITDDDEIKDVLQKTYIKTYDKLNSFKNNSAFSTWLTRIAINEALMHIRKEKQFKNVSIDEHCSVHHSHDNNPEEELILNEKKKSIDDAINDLPTDFKSVFIMRELESMSTKEVSETLNITESNVKIRLKRAKEKLQNHIRHQGDLDQAYIFLGENCDSITEKVMSVILNENK